MRSFVRNAALSSSVLLAVAVGAFDAACSPDLPAASSAAELQTTLDKADWLEKASKAIRNGDGLGAHDDIEALLATPGEAVLDTWMADPRFGDAVLAFNLYYLGRSVDRVKQPTGNGQGFSYDPMVLALPQALAAARAVMAGGDYFDLYAPAVPFFRQSNGPPPVADGGAPSERQRVARTFDEFIASFDAGLKACSDFDKALETAAERLATVGFHAGPEVEKWFGVATPEFPKVVDCKRAGATTAEHVERMRNVKTEVDRIFAVLEAELAPETISSVRDVRAIALPRAEGLPPLVEPLTIRGFWESLASTSTNFHRRRASYVLKTYFCDDLTPLEIPSNPGGADAGGSDVHASQANCQACHYRLDPIGALFRTRGREGREYQGGRKITFDDNSSFTGQDFDAYLGQWRNGDGSFRAGYWVIGQDGKPQREPGWTDADGSTLDGLWSYLPRSKVVQSCLVQRLAEYVLGPQQVYDREWLGQISADFRSGAGSATSFKELVKRLLLSKTFSTQDPKAGECYDLPTNAAPNRSPCAVAHVVSTHCATCHGNTAGVGRIDFKNWKRLPDGTFSWAHHDASGQQLPRAVSLQRMLDRITSPDRSVRMPFQRSMPEADVATFRDWLRESLAATPSP